MKTDKLKEFRSLKKNLLKEKAQLEARLQEINDVLAEGVAGALPDMPAGRKRYKNEMTLKEAVMKVTAKKPLPKEDIIAAVTKLGYRFSGRDPINRLNVLLYGKDPKFKNDKGRFSPA